MADRYDVMVALPRLGQSQTGDRKSDWYKIGVAFAQKNGTGFNIELAGLPIPQGDRCRLILMEARAFAPGGSRPPQRDRFPERAPSGGAALAGPPAGDPNDSLDDLPW